MSKKVITGAEAMMRALQDEGVKTIFGYPGGTIMPVYDKLYDYTRGENAVFNHILVRHEQAAAHAAEGFARVSGEVGVCIVTSGPGATNTLTGVADAMMDSTPIVVIAGQVGVGSLGTDAFQEVDLMGVTQPISKWSYQIRRAEDIAWAVSRAFYIARSGRPGPVVLDFPKNSQITTTQYESKHIDFIRSYVPYPKLNMDKVAEAAELINQAKKPLALVGQGIELGGAHKELIDFLEKADIPFGSTLLGLSIVPSDHPLNKGMLGMHGNYAPNVKTNECDVLIAVGMRFDDRVTGKLSTYARQAKIIHLDIDPAEIDKNIKTDVAVVADCKESLPAITKLLNKAEHRQWCDSFTPYFDEENEKVITPEIHPTDGPLLMGEVVNAVSEATGNDAILVTDVGQNQMMGCRYFHHKQGRSVVTSGGLGTMGFGLPAAVGATFGCPDRTVCVFLGDGGLQMNIQEFGTIMEQQTPVKIILLNNNFLGNVRQWQDMFFNNRRSFTKMINPDYIAIAKAYGIQAETVTDRKELSAAIQRMLNTDGPYMLQTIIKEDENVMPMTPPGGTVNEMLFEA
jgi:acetolactate synthase I/II/III large subunit